MTSRLPLPKLNPGKQKTGQDTSSVGSHRARAAAWLPSLQGRSHVRGGDDGRERYCRWQVR